MVKYVLCEKRYSVEVKEFYRSFHGSAVVWAAALTYIAAPDGIIFLHKGNLTVRKLPAPLSYSRKTVIPLTTEDACEALRKAYNALCVTATLSQTYAIIPKSFS